MTDEESSLTSEDQARLEESQRGLERRRAALGIEPQRDASAQVVAIADQRSQRQKAQRRKHPDAVAEPTTDGDCWHQIEEGLYEAVYVGDASDRKLWGGKRVARLRITDGTHAEKILRWYAQTPLKPGGRTKLAVTYNAVTGRRPPRNLAELKLGRWLSGRLARGYDKYDQYDRNRRAVGTGSKQYDGNNRNDTTGHQPRRLYSRRRSSIRRRGRLGE